MNELEILEQIEMTSGSKAKAELLTANFENKRLRDLLNNALNFFIKFSIKKFEVSTFNQECTDDKHQDLLDILKLLETRTVTGGDAKRLVENFLASCNILQQKWYTRVIQKDLKLGVSISTANKCGFKIPKFDVMLAKDAKKMKKAPDVVKKGVMVSPKLDGYRCLMIWDGKEVQLLSRNGSHYENFPQIHLALTELLSSGFAPLILDGEIMSDSFQAMQQSAFASTRGSSVGDVVYHIFGYIPYDEWINDEFIMETHARYEYLSGMFEQMNIEKNTGGCVKLVEQIYTESWDDILTLEAQWLKIGLEGAMALPAYSPYYKGRKTNQLMKFKTFHTMDCIVEEFDEGNGKNENSLGALQVRQEDGQTMCGVGSGFTDDERAFIWGNKEQTKGRIAEVRYQELTEDGVMRFPTFVRWRDQGTGSGKI